MKFGKTLEQIGERHPSFASYFISYKDLKKSIKLLLLLDDILPTYGDVDDVDDDNNVDNDNRNGSNDHDNGSSDSSTGSSSDGEGRGRE